MRTKSSSKVLMWVDPEFKTMIKIKSAQANQTVTQYTHNLVRESDFELEKSDKIVGGKKFVFKL